MVASSQRIGIAHATTATRVAARVGARMVALALLLGALLGLQAAFAPDASAQNRATATLWLRVDGDDVKAAIEVAIDTGYHLGHGPTEADVGGPDAIGTPTTLDLAGDGFDWSDPRFPDPEREAQDFGKTKTWLWVHHGTPVIWLRGRKVAASADPAKIRITLKGQTCDESGCVPYKQIVSDAGRGSDELFAKFPADLVAPGSEPAAGQGAGGAGGVGGQAVAQAVGGKDGAKDGAAAPQLPPSASKKLDELPLGAFLLSAFLWGLFSLLMPCTYPMIPITISYFTKQASARQTSILPLSLTYGAGIVLIYIAIGVLVGPVVIKFATHWATNLIIGGFFVVFALSLFGLILLQPPQFLLQAAGKATRKGGYTGVFLMGATLVITSFTCTAPFVGSLLAAGASSLPRVVMGMGVFGLTMAVPFVFLSLLPAKAKSLPKSGEWMHTLKVCLGFVELAAALKFISNADLVLHWGVISRELFYLWWAGIFLTCALYLFGILRLHEDDEPVVLEPGTPVRLHASVGSGRMVAGVAFMLFALYNLHGALGSKLDWVMTVMAPPYSTRVGGGEGEATASKSHVIVFDDLDAACARAASEGKLVLVNFTGVT
jgi:cytochrome c biogenesis protein CcdA